MNIYKLSFKDKKAFEDCFFGYSIEERDAQDKILSSTKVDPIVAYNDNRIISIIEIGNIPFDSVLDSSGKVVTPAGIYPDWAVDLVSNEEIPEIDQFLITEKKQYQHSISGGDFTIKVKET